MATAVIMPRQGQSVETCTLSKWFKKRGETVSKGELLFAYDTDKASFEAESHVTGILLEIFVEEDDEVGILDTIAVIGEAGEDIEAFRPSHNAPDDTTLTDTTAEPTNAATDMDGRDNGLARISPRARRLQEQLRVDITGVAGSGPHGRIIEQDIEHAGGLILAGDLEESGAVLSRDDTVVKKLTTIRKIIGQKMKASLENTAQLTLHAYAAADRFLLVRKMMKAGKIELALTINDMVSYALVTALREFPSINAHFTGDDIVEFNNVNLAVAIDTARGLMVPVIRNADALNITELSAAIRSAAAACKEGVIDPEELQGGSFTITNLGMFGIDTFTPVLNPPQVGILGVGAITRRLVETGDDTISFVPHIGLSLTFDHQAIDGGPAAQFLKLLKEKIENFDLTKAAGETVCTI